MSSTTFIGSVSTGARIHWTTNPVEDDADETLVFPQPERCKQALRLPPLMNDDMSFETELPKGLGKMQPRVADKTLQKFDSLDRVRTATAQSIFSAARVSLDACAPSSNTPVPWHASAPGAGT